ncbi:hypothetical protein [Paraburkholderia piptadeniae]|nr:hypothetical protein [Paraburkholderia piptadeniae]
MTSEGTVLTIAAYDGKYTGSLDSLAHLFDLEGSVVPYGRPPFSALEEALKVLELCADKYSTPRAAGKHLTVFVGRGTGTGVKPVLRLDIGIDERHAVATIVGEPPLYAHTATVDVNDDDDVAAIVRKVLTQL